MSRPSRAHAESLVRPPARSAVLAVLCPLLSCGAAAGTVAIVPQADGPVRVWVIGALVEHLVLPANHGSAWQPPALRAPRPAPAATVLTPPTLAQRLALIPVRRC